MPVFNFSANRLQVVKVYSYSKCNLYTVKDLTTKRCYQIYDYSKRHSLQEGIVYCLSGKINSADKLYLILEISKKDKAFYENIKVQ